ncbi:MAG: 16S rRNA (adenine(1518)-N(6)/adenine(1519)-N(6))-dimethyltransferase RsmA [Candidatus Pacebacteria bacterium]|nr:16S rRNA (adenine(1518)-N(6)/adenine(1519)-N(6))-dimethyltransferase RsmA [Candidatus Paceibacterota bacterium]
MLNIQEIKNQLKENNAAALKKFGQNFLVSQSVLAKIIAAANLKPQDTILEIGPGLGGLTFELAKKVEKVIAVEKDKKISAMLEKNLVVKGISNVRVINEDALRPTPLLQTEGWGEISYKLVANLPYNIATAVIMKFLEKQNQPKLIVVMIQKEVAQRITAKPPHMNKLAVFCQLFAEPKIIDYVPSSAFWPKPKVDSAILQLQPFKNHEEFKEPSSLFGRHSVPFKTLFQKIVNAGFSHPRKALLNNLNQNGKGLGFTDFSKDKVAAWLKENNINPMQRPETLSVENWQNLAKTSAAILIHS